MPLCLSPCMCKSHDTTYNSVHVCGLRKIVYPCTCASGTCMIKLPATPHLPPTYSYSSFLSLSLFPFPPDLLQLTSSPHCQMSVLVDLVSDRLRNTNWVVVFKGLIVSHNLMSLGNEVRSFKKKTESLLCVIMICLNGVRPFLNGLAVDLYVFSRA